MRAVLTGHDIPVHISGENQAAMVGLGGSGIAQVVWVPREHADEARALIEEMRVGGEAELADDEIPDDDTAEREEVVGSEAVLVSPGADAITKLNKRNRMFLALATGTIVGHGTAHMSARAWKRGFVLAATQVVGWWTLFVRDARTGAALVLVTMMIDIIGALLLIAQSDSPLPTAKIHRG